MASLNDYLLSTPGQRNKKVEDLLKNINTYQSNRNVLTALGQPDTQKNPAVGLLTGIGKVLGAPGNVIRGGIAEAMNIPNPELQSTSGMDEFKKLLSGEIQVGAGDLPGLQVQAGDTGITKALKLGGAFVGDVATDPLSYVSAPGMLGRKAAGVLLTESAPKLVKDIIDLSPHASNKLAELAKQSNPGRIAEMQTELGVKGLPNTPIDVFTNPLTRDVLVGEQLGNHLGEGLIKGGRREVVRRLEEITGSKDSAMAIFNKLPEDVKGGIVMTGLLGKPLKRADGSYVRLTPGSGESLGKAGDVINKGRLAMSVTANPITRNIGKAGDIYANVKKALLLNEDTLGRDTLLDYAKTKAALGEKSRIRAGLHAKALAAANIVSTAANRYGKDTVERKTFNAAYENAFYAPHNLSPAFSQVESDAHQAAAKLRTELNDIYTEAKNAGVDIGTVGTPDTFTPMMLDDKSIERLRKSERGRMKTVEYSTVYGRNSFIEFLKDKEVMARAGFEDPNNPGVFYLDAREVNKIMEKRGDWRRWEVDPTKVFTKYAYDLGNRIANKRFIDVVTKSGIAFKDVPRLQRLLSEYDSATFLAAMDNLSSSMRTKANEALDNIAKRLGEEIDIKGIKDVKAKINSIQVAAKQEYDVAKANEKTAVEELVKATEDINRLAPQDAAIRARLKQYEANTFANNQDMVSKDRVARQLRAKLYRAENNPEYKLMQEIQNDYAAATDPIEKEMYRSIIDNSGSDLNKLMDTIRELSQSKQVAQGELDAARSIRDSLRKQESSTQIDAVNQYYDAQVRRSAAVDKVNHFADIRRKSKSAHDAASAKAASEITDTLDNLVNEYAMKNLELRQYNHATESQIKDMTANSLSKEEIKAYEDSRIAGADMLKSSVDAREKLLKHSIAYTSKKFEGVAREYADTLIKSVENLTAEEMAALSVLKSERKIQELMNTIMGGTRDEEVVLQAMGDMYRTYAGIRDKVDISVLNKLASAQQAILTDSGFSKLEKQLYREKVGPSALGEKLIDVGYEAIGLNKATTDLYAASGVRNLMESIYRTESDPTPFQKALNTYFDPLLQLWKTSVTVGRGPGYVLTNIMGGIYMNWLGNVSGADMTLSGKVLMKVNKNLRDIEKAFPNRSFFENLTEAEKLTHKELSHIKIGDSNMYDVMTEFFARGGFFDTETQFGIEQVKKAGSNAAENAFRRTGSLSTGIDTTNAGAGTTAFANILDFAMTNRVQRAMNNGAQSSEMFLRLGAFIDGYRKYKNFESAMSQVHLLHFNYQDLSDAEQWVRRFVPFYTWSRNNVPAQLRAIMLQPGKLNRLMYANQEFQNTYGASGDESWLNQVLPEYVNVSDGFASKFKFGNNNIGFFLKLPNQDINRLFQINKNGIPGVRTRELANMLGPFTTPIEMITGTNLSTGAAFNPAGESVPGYYNLLSHIPGSGVYTDKNGQVRAPGWFARGMGDLAPGISTAERAVNAATVLPTFFGKNAVTLPGGAQSPAQREKAFTDFLNITGLSAAAGGTAVTLTPQSLSGELMRRQTLQGADIKKVAAQGNIDVDWIRAQLRAGKSPDQIAMLINSGLGKISAIPQKSTITAASLKTAQTNLNNLGA